MNPTPADWQQAFALLDDALELPAAERAAWLDTLAPGRAHLRPLLQRLLADRSRIETDDFLGRGAAPAVQAAWPAPAPELEPGGALGPWRLLRRLGEGGMAQVWLADRADGAHKRVVALKLPFVHGRRAPLLVERFERERDILSGLSHPHIAAVLDAGLHEGQPWLAMEYVDGTPITEHCQSHALPVRARLPLFLQVLAAVQHAHARLVIHRDLKPSNVLVDADGQAKLLDFGVAKLLQDDGTAAATALTQEGGRALTPQYASPEQIRGEPLGTASDVYSLGVLLYELLSGARPYKLARDTPAALEEAILRADVLPPSRAVPAGPARRALQGDLDTVVLKAMAPRPAERYESVQALAADLRAHLELRPIAARPTAPLQRLGKWARRHALAVAAGGALGLALLAGAATTAWQARIAHDEAARAERAKRFVLSIFEDADSTAGANRQTTARDLLEQAQPRAAREFAGDLATQVELQASLAYSLLGQGAAPQAVAALEPLVARAATELGPRHRQTLRAQRVLGEAFVDVGRSADAVTALRSAAEGAAAAGEATVRVGALQWLASALLDQGKPDDALDASRRAVELADRPDAQVDPAVRMYAWFGAGNIRASTGRPGIADAARRGLAIGATLYGEREPTPMLTGRLLLGRGQQADGDYAAAVQTLQAMLERLTALHGPQHPHSVATARYLGAALRDAGQPEAALARFREVLAGLEVMDGGKPTPRRGIAHANLADTLNQLGRPAEALAAARAGRAIFESLGPLTVAAARPLRLATGEALAALGRPADAEAELQALLDSLPAADAAQRARVEGPLAVLQAARGDTAAVARAARAEAALQGALPLARGRAALALGRALLAARRPAEALPALQRAVQSLQAAQPQGSPLVTAALQAQAEAERPR